jgi:hypothetical protein
VVTTPGQRRNNNRGVLLDEECSCPTRILAEASENGGIRSEMLGQVIDTLSDVASRGRKRIRLRFAYPGELDRQTVPVLRRAGDVRPQ